MSLCDLARAIAPDAELKTVGIRPGEKLHEVMVPVDEARSAVELEDRYIILPSLKWRGKNKTWEGAKPCTDGFSYASNTNEQWLDKDGLQAMVAALDLPEAKEWAKLMGL